MVSFNNTSFKLKEADGGKNVETIKQFLVSNEEIVGFYQAARDYVVFTNKRLIVVDVQGITGKKQDFSSLPYKSITAFSVKTAGALDNDSDVELYIPGLGGINLEFTKSTNTTKICKLIGDSVL